MLYFGDAGRVSPYSSPNASPRVGYTALELDSDLTFENGDNKSGSGGTGLGMGLGMGDLGEPPISVGFSDEVALSRRRSYAGLDAGAGGGSQKAESVVSAGERSQSRQPRSSNKVPSGSQTDVLPVRFPKVNVYSQRISSTA